MARSAKQSLTESVKHGTSKRAAADTPTRTSKRARASTGKSYAEPDTDSDAGSNSRNLRDDAGSADASDFEAHTEKEASSESEPEADTSDEEPTSKKSTPRGRSHKKPANEKELWKPGAKLEPGTQLIIKKPKAREAGTTPYTESTIHPNTMLFLKEIKENNDRQWLKLHDPDYRVAVQDFNDFIGKLSERIIEIDETIPELPVKDIVYRIYRGILSSASQRTIIDTDRHSFLEGPDSVQGEFWYLERALAPFWEMSYPVLERGMITYFSAAWSRTGRKGPYAAYYVQVQPNGGSFVGGGLWQPDAESLRKLRREFDRRSTRIKAVLKEDRVRKNFLGGVSTDEAKVVKAFIGLTSNASTALKRNPKDFPLDHQDIDLLRLRNFTLGKKFSDEEIVGPKGMDRIAELISCIEPFITYLNSVVMPDDESSSSSEGDDESGDESSAADLADD
ncbi:hypothetical protein E8E13_010251 [Curvularia kusanoi]|uniref:Uncharacterized protein n=1 Tax=Curvularia kusanoi TaxID=90978 RepID=A0A9P4TN67_CURKU|nr:hypothetical protein E8E13_010251 [Curvularia kusanoi]